jgi:hypothetical protein
MGAKPRAKARYTDCLCCGNSIGCRTHTNCKQLCLVGLCLDCVEGDCLHENASNIADELDEEQQRHEEVMQRLTDRFNVLNAADKRAEAWRIAKAAGYTLVIASDRGRTFVRHPFPDGRSTKDPSND